jgi:uncharacterized protein (DUF305 family)
MQINIDKKTGILLSLVGLLSLALLVVGFNAAYDDDDLHGKGHMDGMHSSESGNLSGADVMFLQMMIPHHEQAIVMSDLALKISKNSKILELANQIKAAQAPEILQMKAWLAEVGAGEDPGHSMDGMGGMLSEQELETLSRSSGKSFEKLFLSGMIEHHQGAIQMVNMIKNSSNLEIREFGEKIIKTQSAEIGLMNELIAALN